MDLFLDRQKDDKDDENASRMDGQESQGSSGGKKSVVLTLPPPLRRLTDPKKTKDDDGMINNNIAPFNLDEKENDNPWKAHWTPLKGTVIHTKMRCNKAKDDDEDKSVDSSLSQVSSSPSITQDDTDGEMHNEDTMGSGKHIRNISENFADSPDSSEILKRIVLPNTPGGRDWTDSQSKESIKMTPKAATKSFDDFSDDSNGKLEHGVQELARELNALEESFEITFRHDTKDIEQEGEEEVHFYTEGEEEQIHTVTETVWDIEQGILLDLESQTNDEGRKAGGQSMNLVKFPWAEMLLSAIFCAAFEIIHEDAFSAKKWSLVAYLILGGFSALRLTQQTESDRKKAKTATGINNKSS